MPLHECFRVGGDVEVFIQSGIRLADLSLAVLEQQPVALVGPEAGEIQPDDYTLARKLVPSQRVAHRPQRHEWIEVLGGDLEPPSSPLAEGLADLEQVMARAGELVTVTAPLRLRCRLDNAEALSCWSRSARSVWESPGAPSRISPKVSQPRCRLRMINGVQRSAKISEPRAIGQYCP